MSTSPYEIFEVNAEAENVVGIFAEYPVPGHPKRAFKLRFVHAGETNVHYRDALRARLKPLNYRLQQDLVPDEEYEDILKKIYAEKIIKEGLVKDDEGNWVAGIYGPDFTILPFNKENVYTVFQSGPRLFKDIKKQAENFATFKKRIQEVDSKN